MNYAIETTTKQTIPKNDLQWVVDFMNRKIYDAIIKKEYKVFVPKTLIFGDFHSDEERQEAIVNFIRSRGFDCGKEPMVFGDYVSEPQWCMYLNRQY